VSQPVEVITASSLVLAIRENVRLKAARCQLIGVYQNAVFIIHFELFEGGQMPINRRLPKRGFHNPFRIAYETVNVDTLSERFEAGTEITPSLLREQRLISRRALVKVLARGELTKKLTVKAHGFSKKAAELIVAAGGQTEVLPRVGQQGKESTE